MLFVGPRTKNALGFEKCKTLHYNTASSGSGVSASPPRQLQWLICCRHDLQLFLVDKIVIPSDEEKRKQYAIGILSVFEDEELALPMLLYAVSQEIKATGMCQVEQYRNSTLPLKKLMIELFVSDRNRELAP